MRGCFNVYSNNDNEEYDINCQLDATHAKDDIPIQQQDLYVEIESASNIIKSLINTKKDKKTLYFNKLVDLAQAGLVSDVAQPELALKSLEKLKSEIVLIEGQRIKNYYMKQLGLKSLLLIVISIVLYILTCLVANIESLMPYFMAWIGAMIGAWISFGARKFTIEFEQLSLLEEDMMSPFIRLIYIGLCSIVVVLFLNCGIIKIDVGDISTINLESNIHLQLAIGVLCGLIESKIGINIYKKAKNIIGE